MNDIPFDPYDTIVESEDVFDPHATIVSDMQFASPEQVDESPCANSK